MSSEVDAAGLFKDTRFYAIGDLDEQIKRLLENGGAKEESYLSAIATHAIATDFDSVDLEEAQDCWQIPTVTERWVLLSSKCKKLLPTEAFTPSNSQLFSGCVFCPSQLSAKDRDLVWACITFYGGSCQLVLNQKCTHLLVPKPEGAKYDEAMKHTDVITVVTPDWIFDSIKSKTLEDTKKYHPSLIVTPEPEIQPSLPETQTSQQDVISSSLQSVDIGSSGDGSNVTTAERQQKPKTTPAIPPNKPEMLPGSTAVVPTTPGHIVNRMPTQQTIIVSQSQTMTAPSTSQPVISQGGKQYLITGQTLMQQFQMQQQMVPTQHPRFSTPNAQPQFQNVTAQNQTDHKQSATQKKAKAQKEFYKIKSQNSKYACSDSAHARQSDDDDVTTAVHPAAKPANDDESSNANDASATRPTRQSDLHATTANVSAATFSSEHARKTSGVIHFAAKTTHDGRPDGDATVHAYGVSTRQYHAYSAVPPT